MALRTWSTEGRVLHVSNVSGKALPVAGTMVRPGQTRTVRASQLQSRVTPDDGGPPIAANKHMIELQLYLAAGLITVHMDGEFFSADDGKNSDCPLSGDFQVAREIWTAPALADVNAIKTAFAAPAVATTYSGSDLDGVVGFGMMGPPRNITIKGTTVGGEGLIQKDVIISGLDIDGGARTDSIRCTALGASDTATYTGVIAFSRITSVYLPLDNSGSPGDYEIGFGNLLGFSKPLTRGGVFGEYMDNAAATAGTVVLSGTSAPNGTYLANTVPDAAHDYIVSYIPGG